MDVALMNRTARSAAQRLVQGGNMTSRILSESLAVSRRILTELTRTRRSLIFWAIFPTLMLLLFGTMYASGKQPGVSFDHTAPNILIGAAMFFSCLGGTVSTIAAERERRTLRRLLLSPLSPASYFLGIVGAYMVIALAQTLVVYAIALAFGGRFHGNWVLGLAIIGVSVCAYVGLGFFFGARFARRTEDVNGPIAGFGVPLLVLGGTFFPISLLPQTLLVLAEADPVFHMNQALKGVWAEGKTLAELLPDIAFLCGFAALALWLGIRSYRAMLIQEKTS
jgi:ABC-2 type transport system permease protein